MARCALPCVERVVFAIGGKTTSGGKHQESKASYLQPELVDNSGEMLERRSSPAHHGAERPAALDMLPGNASCYTQFAGGRNVCHSSRFYQAAALEWLGGGVRYRRI